MDTLPMVVKLFIALIMEYHKIDIVCFTSFKTG